MTDATQDDRTVDPDSLEAEDGTVFDDSRLDVTRMDDRVVVTMHSGYVEHITAIVEEYGWSVVEMTRGERSGNWLATIEDGTEVQD